MTTAVTRTRTVIIVDETQVQVDDLGGHRFQLLEDVNRYFLKGDVCLRTSLGWRRLLRVIPSPERHARAVER